MCQKMQKPVHEVLSMPSEELSWWAAFDAIDRDDLRPEFPKYKTTEEQDIQAFKKVLS